MKPFYTIDAGEFLVGSHLKKILPDISIWFPSKDEGDDFLLLNRSNGKIATLQIKVSRDYLITHMDAFFHPHLRACGWFTPTRKKIAESKSDLWILGLHCYGPTRLNYVVLTPKQLLRRFDQIHPGKERLQSYLWLTKADKVFETRGLKKDEQRQVANGEYSNSSRDFTQFLNNWEPLKRKLGVRES